MDTSLITNAINLLKEARSIKNKADFQHWESLVQDSLEAIQDLREDNLALRQQVEKLKEAENAEFKDNAYWISNVPHCKVCYGNGKKIPLTDYEDEWRCDNHNPHAKYMDKK